MAVIRSASQEDRPRIASFYSHAKYGEALSQDDILLLAEKDGGICGALRLCREHGVLVLRGMRIDQVHQRKGIGSQLLQKAVAFIHGQECYCIPHRQLAAFYQQVGFQQADPATGPRFLADRLAKYQANLGLDVILMRREKEQPPQPSLGSAAGQQLAGALPGCSATNPPSCAKWTLV